LLRFGCDEKLALIHHRQDRQEPKPARDAEFHRACSEPLPQEGNPPAFFGRERPAPLSKLDRRLQRERAAQRLENEVASRVSAIGKNGMLAYLEPWKSVPVERRAQIEAELARELHPKHALAGRTLRVVAARCDCDDVLCEVAGLGYAVVHVTWSGLREQSPQWPTTEIFSSPEDWQEQGMRRDHEEYASNP
jgi:hypothetical protein